MSVQPIDRYVERIAPDVQTAVMENSITATQKRHDALFGDYEDPDKIRRIAGAIKQHTVEHLDRYLPQAEEKLKANGVKVHWASDGEEANRIVFEIMRSKKATKVVKSKSMVSEETELGHYLEERGMECVETDLGEYIVQIDNDHPSHIVKPIIHKNRQDVARSFEREGLGEYNDDPEVITHRARKHLRGKYMEADVGITGANFVSAESGRMLLITNEGNSRFCLAPTKVHIAMVGIEKLVPKDRDLSVMLNLLARSATGQRLTVYTEFISGPKSAAQPDGPEEMHLIFLDNRRTQVLESDCREILRCIRCGACMNVCPVYRQASGFAYRSVYPGPLGAVLSPLLASKFADYADLPKASSLCGACNEVCPVDIPIPDLLLRLRDKAKVEGIKSPGTPPMGMWATMASKPVLWKTALSAGKMMDFFPKSMIPVPAFQAWYKKKDLPEWHGKRFRSWMANRPNPKKNDQPEASEK